MTVPRIFATHAAGNVPASYLDEDFAYLSASIGVNLRDYGADPTGGADATASLVAAIVAAKAQGLNAVDCSGGKWLIDTGGIVLNNISLFSSAPPDFGDTYGDSGATFLLTSTTTSPFTLEQGWAITGITFYYPNQTGASTATVYPPLFTGTYIAGGVMEDCTVLNAYQFFKSEVGFAIGDFRLDRCRIYAIDRVFWLLEGAPEVFNISDCIFSYGIFAPSYSPNTYLRDHTITAGEFLRMDVAGGNHPTVDGLNLSNSMVFGYRYGLRLVSGWLNVSEIHDNWFDQVSTALSVDDPASFTNCRWTGNYLWSATIADTTTDHPTIYLSSTSAISNLNITDNDFAYSQGDHIQWNAASVSDANISGNRFRSWGQRSGGSPDSYYAINATDHASLVGTIVGNLFQPISGAVAHNRNGIGIGAATSIAILSNTFDACYLALWIVSATSARVIGNTSHATSSGNSFRNDTAAGVVEAAANLWDKAPVGPSGSPSFLAQGATQTFTGVKTQALFGTINFDSDSNIASSTFTAPTSDDYEFSVQLLNDVGVTAGSIWLLSIEQAGSAAQLYVSSVYVPANTLGAAPVQCTARFRLAAGDTVAAYITHSSGGGSYVTLNDASVNTFSGSRVGP